MHGISGRAGLRSFCKSGQSAAPWSQMATRADRKLAADRSAGEAGSSGPNAALFRARRPARGRRWRSAFGRLRSVPCARGGWRGLRNLPGSAIFAMRRSSGLSRVGSIRPGISAEVREGVNGTFISVPHRRCRPRSMKRAVEYRLPTGQLGDLADARIARRQMEAAFRYRQGRLEEILAGSSSAGRAEEPRNSDGLQQCWRPLIWDQAGPARSGRRRR
jgi:hypothetical protein